MTAKPKDLEQIIRDNPGCIAEIDNDCWTLFKSTIEDPPDFDGDDDRKDDWYRDQILADSTDKIVSLGDGGYGSGSEHGGDILQAIAKIVGVKIKSV